MTNQLSLVIKQVFSGVFINPAISSDGIREQPSLMELAQSFELMRVVPLYLDFCVNEKDRTSLVFDYTLNALAEFGRSKNSSLGHLNFRFQCNNQQRAIVISFLEWCKAPDLLLQPEQIDRAIKSWSRND